MNKRTVEVKEALSLAFDKIGGITAFAEWAKENQTDYYKLYAKLLPRDINLSVNVDLQLCDALLGLPEK